MSLALATLCLNEMEWLPRLWEQHRRWPTLTKWVFVEAADRLMTGATADGLSTDGTTEFLASLPHPAVHVRHGWTDSEDPAQGKCAARNRYLDELETLHPQLLFVLDADEFYSHEAQGRIVELMHRNRADSFVFKQRHLWRPPSIEDFPLTYFEVVGGYWNVPHCRGWRWEAGLRYVRNHNWPEKGGKFHTAIQERLDREGGSPYCVHTGYASKGRAAKHRYYEARGEALSRPKYVDCRRAFETWRPGDVLPHGAKVILYRGEIPEALCQNV